MGVQIQGDTGNVIATKGTYSGNVTVGGTLTYEDVTNIDSVGLVTARQGIEVGARPGVAASISVDGNAIFSGITTIGGNVKVGTGITISPDGDVFFTGIITGNGSGLTNAGPSLTGSTNNTVVTVTGANAIQGESNLTFDGSDLTITNSGASNKGIKLTATGNYYPSIIFDANRSAENNAIVWIDGKWNGTTVGAISVEAGDDTTNKDDGKVTFYTTQGGTATRKMAIEQDGNVHIDTGNIVIGTAGKGIDFSAQTASSLSGVSVSSELLDHYEEGTFTPTFGASNGSSTTGYSTQSGKYTRIGNTVHVQIRVTLSSLSTSSHSHAWISGLPIASAERTATSSIVCGGIQGSGFDSIAVAGRTEASGTRIELFRLGDGGSDDLSTSIINGTAFFIVQCTYRAA